MVTETDSDGLVRELSWVHSASVIIGTMIGAGIFVITAEAAGAMGPAVPLGFLLAIPIIVSTALVYSVFMSSPLGEHPGGAYVHISRTWDSLYAGAMFMWLKWVSFVGALVVLAIGFGEAMLYFDSFAFLSVQGWAIVWLTVFFALNLSGVDMFGHVQAILTGTLVLILVALAVPGLAFIDVGNFTPLFPDEIYSGGFIDPFLGGMAALMFAYVGFEALAQTAGETKAPRETLPRVFAYSAVFVGILYTLVTVVVVGVLGWETAAGSGTPLTEAAEAYFPLGTAGIIAFGSMLAYATSLNSSFLVPSRILYMFGQDKLIPQIFTRVNDRFKTPDVGLALTWVVAVGILVTGTFEFALMIALTALFLLYAAHSLSAVALPWVRPDLYEKCDLQFKPAVLAAIGLFSAFFMAVFSWQTLQAETFGPAVELALQGDIVGAMTQGAAFTLLVWTVLGALIFVGYRWYLKSQDALPDQRRELRELYHEDESSTFDD